MATLNLKKKKFIDEDALKKIVAIGINFGERLNSIETSLIAEYDSTKTYIIGEACYHDNYIYKCKSTATGEWNPDRWQLIGDDITELTLDEIKAMLGLTTEQLTTLSSIILDSEVRLDKTYSSSKIYSSIQNAIDTAKAYTLSELGKISGASYKIANSTSDMTDEKVIYLLQNGSTYDMYIVDGGTPVKIGDTTIDLSGYYTKTEIDNDFLKKTDATSTYATKTEVNDKVDKTSILSATSSTATDDNLYSAKLINGELNKKLNANELVVGDKGEWSALQCELTDGSKSYRLQIDKDGNANIFTSTDNWSTYTFKKVCTTSIEDVAKTTITFSDTTYFEAWDSAVENSYQVKNGICYVNVNIKCNSTPSGGFTLKTDMPVPNFNIVHTSIPAFSEVVSETSYKELTISIASGRLIIYNGTAGCRYLGIFSYPVKES